MKMNRLLSYLAVILMLPSVAAAQDALPTDIARELKPLMDRSTVDLIVPEVYELAGNNQEYSDEIACRLVRVFGISEQIKADMLAVVDSPEQQEQVVSAVENCMHTQTAELCQDANAFSPDNIDRILKPISEELDPLMEKSSGGEISPEIYVLAGARPAYSDEIACKLVRNFGQPGEVRSNMLSVVANPQQQQQVIIAIRNCEREREGGYCGALRSVRPMSESSLFNTQESVQGTVENASSDVATSVTPSE